MDTTPLTITQEKGEIIGREKERSGLGSNHYKTRKNRDLVVVVGEGGEEEIGREKQRNG
jgi:hypothetical protein